MVGRDSHGVRYLPDHDLQLRADLGGIVERLPRTPAAERGHCAPRLSPQGRRRIESADHPGTAVAASVTLHARPHPLPREPRIDEDNSPVRSMRHRTRTVHEPVDLKFEFLAGRRSNAISPPPGHLRRVARSTPLSRTVGVQTFFSRKTPVLSTVPTMAERRSQTARKTRCRRAKREDITALVDCVGGPAAARVRVLRRLLKTLAADIYVLDRDGVVAGIVALHYRRSLAHGGLLATIDAMMSLRSGDEEIREDLSLLMDCALKRAERRNSVGIDTSLADERLRRLLRENGFETGPEQLARSLRSEENQR